MPEKRFYGVNGSTKGGHSRLRGPPLQHYWSIYTFRSQF